VSTLISSSNRFLLNSFSMERRRKALDRHNTVKPDRCFSTFWPRVRWGRRTDFGVINNACLRKTNHCAGRIYSQASCEFYAKRVCLRIKNDIFFFFYSSTIVFVSLKNKRKIYLNSNVVRCRTVDYDYNTIIISPPRVASTPPTSETGLYGQN